jgi:hypothetical protein
MIIFSQLQNLFRQLFRVGFRTVVLQVELNLLDGLREHELMLRDVHFLPILVQVELLVYLDDFLEVQLLKVNIHPSNKEVDQVALLQLIIPQTPQSFQHL